MIVQVIEAEYKALKTLNKKSLQTNKSKNFKTEVKTKKVKDATTGKGRPKTADHYI